MSGAYRRLCSTPALFPHAFPSLTFSFPTLRTIFSNHSRFPFYYPFACLSTHSCKPWQTRSRSGLHQVQRCNCSSTTNLSVTDALLSFPVVRRARSTAVCSMALSVVPARNGIPSYFVFFFLLPGAKMWPYHITDVCFGVENRPVLLVDVHKTTFYICDAGQMCLLDTLALHELPLPSQTHPW